MLEILLHTLCFLFRVAGFVAKVPQRHLRVKLGNPLARLLHFPLLESLHGIAVCGVNNSGSAPADVGGWYIISEKGNQIYVLPEGTAIVPGGQLVIGSQSSDEPGALTWPDKKVWHKSKEDAALLYDVYGRLIDSMN